MDPMMISLASVPLSNNAVAQVIGGEALSSGLQKLTISLELKCALTGEWFSWDGDSFTLEANADRDNFEEILRAKIAERVDIAQDFLSPAGQRRKVRSEITAKLSEKLTALTELIEEQGESELSKLSREAIQLSLHLNAHYIDEINERS